MVGFAYVGGTEETRDWQSRTEKSRLEPVLLVSVIWNTFDMFLKNWGKIHRGRVPVLPEYC